MRFAPVLIVLSLSIFYSSVSLADKVGITVDARKTVKATGGGDPRILASNTSIFRDDRLRANSSGNAQIRLIDGTKIVVGPNADVKIDDFVITGQTVSKLTVSATRGAFRFISGRSKSSAYSIRTPNGTIGVRGTAFDGQSRLREPMSPCCAVRSTHATGVGAASWSETGATMSLSVGAG